MMCCQGAGFACSICFSPENAGRLTKSPPKALGAKPGRCAGMPVSTPGPAGTGRCRFHGRAVHHRRHSPPQPPRDRVRRFPGSLLLKARTEAVQRIPVRRFADMNSGLWGSAWFRDADGIARNQWVMGGACFSAQKSFPNMPPHGSAVLFFYQSTGIACQTSVSPDDTDGKEWRVVEMALCPTAPPTAYADMRSLLWSTAIFGPVPHQLRLAIRGIWQRVCPYRLPEFTSCRLKLQLSYTRFLTGKIQIEPLLGLNERREIVLFPGFPLQAIRKMLLGLQSRVRQEHRPSPQASSVPRALCRTLCGSPSPPFQ